MAAFTFCRKLLFKAETIVCLTGARLLIRFIPFRWWRRVLGPLGRSAGDPARDLPAEKVRRAVQIGTFVTRMADTLPFESVCLTKAMAGRWMLARREIPTRIVLGLRKGDAQEDVLHYHAWLIAGTRTVIGEDKHRRYKAFEGTGP